MKVLSASGEYGVRMAHAFTAINVVVESRPGVMESFAKPRPNRHSFGTTTLVKILFAYGDYGVHAFTAINLVDENQD